MNTPWSIYPSYKEVRMLADQADTEVFLQKITTKPAASRDSTTLICSQAKAMKIDTLSMPFGSKAASRLNRPGFPRHL